MDKPVHLSWPSHKNELTALFFTYRLNNTFCDVTICCNGVYFPAHRLILATFSAYFKEILEMVPCKHPYIIVQDIHVDDLKDLLDFIYIGEITIENHRMESFFKVARSFGMNGADTKENFLLFNTTVDSGRSKINVDMTPKESIPSKFVEEDPLATIYIQNIRTVFNRDFKTAFTNKFEDLGKCSEDFKICDDLRLEREQTETCSPNAIVEELFQHTNHSDRTRNEEVESLLHYDDIKIEVDDVFGHSRTPIDDMEVSEGNPVNFNEEITNICKNSESCERDSVSQDQINVISPFLKHEVEEETDAHENDFNENETEIDHSQDYLHFITEKLSDNMNKNEKRLEIQQKKASCESSKKVFNNFNSSKASNSRRHARKKSLKSSHSIQKWTLNTGINSFANESNTRDRSLHENNQNVVIDEGKYSFERNSEIKASKQKYILKDKSEEGRVFVCRLCPFVSSSQIDFMYHKNDHRRNSHHCSICPYRANTKLNLIRHVELHKYAQKHQCKLCSYVTANKYQLEYHLNIHSGEMPYKCDVCPYESKGKSNLVAHIRRHSLVKVPENKSSIDERKVSLNVEEICPSNEYRCNPVNDDNITVMGGENVINEKMNSSTQNKSSGMGKKCDANKCTSKCIKVDKKFYKCSICPYKAIRKCTIIRHTMQVHAFHEIYVRKESCDEKRTKDCLTKSCRTKHSSDNYDYKDIITEDLPSMCDSVETKPILTSDQRGDEKIDLNKFNEQNITSISSINETKLKKHKKFHVSKMFKCQLCPYQHHYRPYYTRHMKMHSKINGFKYQCDKCLYGANSQHLIRYHQNVHNGEKPFKCEQCKFAAVDKGHLTQHILKKH